MMRRFAAGLPVLTSILAVFWARSALADPGSCSPMAIEADVSVSVRWPWLLDRVREVFETRNDVDRCARVKLTSGGGSLSVEVTLPDGRSTARGVSRTEDVVPTLEALLLVPQRTAQVQTAPLDPPGTDSPPASSPSAPPAEASPLSAQQVPSYFALAMPDRDAPSASLARHPSRLRIELSVLTGARIGDGQAGMGLGVLSFLELSGWLVGFEVRADRYQSLSGGPTDRGALELAVLGGRRFRFQSIAIDLTAGPALVPQGTTTFETRSATGGDVTQSTSSIAPRLLFGARVSFSALSTLHPFVGLDGELGPRRAGDGDGLSVPGAPRLPLWTLGLALGATVGTQ
jgi:hypothetical protein